MPEYTADQRAEALHLYQEHGAVDASTRTGIPRRTISRWATRAGVVPQVNREKTEAARAVAAEKVATVWADFRSREATASGATAAAIRAVIRYQLQEHPENGRNLQSLAIAYGIMIDKAELLSGQATARIEVWAESELDRDLRALIDEMEARINEG